MSDVFDLTCELIRRASVTPDDAGCQAMIAARLAKAGFRVRHLRFGEVDNLWATHGDSGPGSSWAPVMSGDGRHVAWNDYVTHEVFVRDLDTGLVASASLDSEGVPSDGITVSISQCPVSLRSSTLAGRSLMCRLPASRPRLS